MLEEFIEEISNTLKEMDDKSIDIQQSYFKYGINCRYNGRNPQYECRCDNCNYYLSCCALSDNQEVVGDAIQ